MKMKVLIAHQVPKWECAEDISRAGITILERSDARSSSMEAAEETETNILPRWNALMFAVK